MHIPETGGINFRPQEGVLPKLISSKHEYKYIKHNKGLIVDPKDEKGIFVCMVRNPWDRMVSIYKYFNKPYRLMYIDGNESGERCYHSIAHAKIYNQTFAQFVSNYDAIRRSMVWPHYSHFVSQCRYIYRRRDVAVDRIMRFENYTDDIHEFLKDMGIIGPNEEVHLPILNSTDHPHYTTYYDNAGLIEKVGKIFKKDVINFGYEFNSKGVSK